MRVLLPFLALYRRHWIRMSLGMLLAIATLLASIGLLTLSGWFLAASALAGIASLISFNYMLPAAGVRGAAIIRTAGRYAERLVSHDATFRVLSHLRVFTFSRLIPLSPGGLARFRQAELLNRLVADVDTLDHLYLRVISPLLSAVVIIAVVVCGLSWLDLRLALTLGSIMLALLLGLPTLFYLAGKPVGAALTALRADYRTQLVGWIRANAELAVYGAQETFRQRLDNKERLWQRQQQRQAALGALSQGIMILASGLTFTLILWLAAAGIAGDPRPGALIALFVFAALAAFEALAPVAGAFQHLGQVIASAERIGQLIDQTPQVRFPEQGKTLDDDAPLAMTLDDLHFTYPGQTRPVLNGVSLDLRAGEHIALLGRTGCGKSTLLQLLTRAWDCNSGEIRLNGQRLIDLDEGALRSACAIVSQRIHIFSATLRDNLLLADPQASDAQLCDVLRTVGLDTLLEDHALDAWLGDGGRPLSGGEQRRLGIARALLHRAPLLLLDEPTEGLDAETERQILALLRQHCCQKTLVLITHRLQGLALMDRICVMDDGRIVEQGRHEQLLQAHGRYYQLCQRR
ncbi:cysteine/glutathione ABC transporter ATP-binding protein/permease CydC [Edwardsiella ictaluri]|uniref:Glutathione/L-cysteine transport system ATP-binding/permease protein CydC n=2 Tax=Edwardsiella ictaluri TaxID=67780 RepID=C5BE97_EDWI9|nr:cysteine/glutathione ABC transporter ATP-binding protein/permease CydC [Edwardsiella ictaluri]ACR69658.1 ABC transporter, CydDC cysteine exporter family, permease/ATP-binding protein CydC, putative [Edwardsiella ictaluri 93-146]AVZ83354.1 cysteine/glutathione ABC transporter ATP-binding protein/permease CydC [Edwardsiella ictaluri]EKS7764553.1 cysteine/glutathione ABC transporter ATP-binding protein/permease CydC [Edwardsiella ictaluri]EKS7771456.1 cysteine/glutathione ABC transporter ATP-bi